MTINSVKAGKGLTGGGSTPQVTLTVDSTTVPMLVGDNEYKGKQKIHGTVNVNGGVFANQFAVGSAQQVPKLNATFVGGVAVGGLAQLAKKNTFKQPQTVNAALRVTSGSDPAGTFDSVGNSQPALVATGGDNFEASGRGRVPEAPPAIVGYGGMQHGSGLGAAGDGVYGEGGEQRGRGTGGSGVGGTGGFGGDGGFGGTGGGFLGGTARNGEGGTGVWAKGGTAEPRTRPLTNVDGYGGGDGIRSHGGYSYDPGGAPAGTGGVFFGGHSQFGHGADGIWCVPGYSKDRAHDGRAGVFQGDVWVQGELTAADKNFRIDHPLSPETRVLTHACVESSERLTIYTGNVLLDRRGRAVVKLPKWFEALNRDFRYSLTSIGRFTPVFVSREVGRNRFEIGGGAPGQKISWQLTAVRRDPLAEKRPLVVESEKPRSERGFYLHPEAYGLSAEASIQYARDPRRVESRPAGPPSPPARTKRRKSARRVLV